MAGYVNNPVGPAPALTHYVDNPTSNPTGVGANYANSPVDGFYPPGAPFNWFDAQNINGLDNVGINDADPIGTWNNQGSVGAAGNLVQGVAGSRPLFRLVASGGTLNGKSALESPAADRFMSTAAFTSQPQRILTAIMFRPTNFTGTYVWFSGNVVGEREMWTLNASGIVHQYAGTDASSLLGPTVAKWNLVILDYNGASSVVRINGTQSGALNPGAGAMAGVTLFAETPAAAAKATGMIAEHIDWVSGYPTYADIEAYFLAKYGVTPE